MKLEREARPRSLIDDTFNHSSNISLDSQNMTKLHELSNSINPTHSLRLRSTLYTGPKSKSVQALLKGQLRQEGNETYDEIKQAISNHTKVKVDLKRKDAGEPQTAGKPNQSGLPPLAPKFSTPQHNATEERKFQFKNQRLFEDNIILINPMVDCSEKEIHQRNGFKSAGQNLVSFLQNGGTGCNADKVFIPERLGEMTKDNMGTIKAVGSYLH